MSDEQAVTGTVDEVFQNFTVYCEVNNNPMEFVVTDELRGIFYDVMFEYFGNGDGLPLKALDPTTQIIRPSELKH